LFGPACPICVSFASCVSLSAPSPCERRYRLRVVWADPTPEGHLLPYLSFRICLPVPSGGGCRLAHQDRNSRVSQVLDLSLRTFHALCDPRDPRNAHQNAFSVLASRPLKPSPSALMPITGLYQASGSAVSLVAYAVPCVRFSFVVRRLIPEVRASSSGSSGSLVSLPRSRGFPYTAVTPLTDLSLLLHCCNTRYEWLVRPCSTETSTLQKSVKLCLAH